MQPLELPPSLIRRAIAISIAAHLVVVITAWQGCPHVAPPPEVIDIEVAPEAPDVEALPEEVVVERGNLAARAEPDKPEDPAKPTDPPEPGDEPVDAGVDAPPDSRPDARPDAAIVAKLPDAAPDAAPDADTMIVTALDGPAGDAGVDAEPAVATVDAAPPDAEVVAAVDAAPEEEDAQVAATDPWAEGSGAGDGSGSGSGAGVGASAGSGVGSGAAGSGSGVSGMTNDPAVAGAATTAGTAANLLAYFPPGHQVTALIRFDRLRGTEWLKQTERLLQPMPDYQVLFGTRDAKIGDKLDTLVISTPAPRDATATTLVGHTALSRSGLRDFLSAATPIAWSPAKGGLLGKRTGKKFPGDRRLFLSPYDGWFLLAQPADLGGLTGAAAGSLDTVVATAKLPPWLSAVRTIEKESGGDKRGPSLVLTVALDGTPIETGPLEAAIGVKQVQQPERISLAAELVPQGWLVRGNMRFKDAAAATAFVSQVATVQQRIVGASRVYDAILGKAAVSVIGRFKFARTGPKVSYTTSISIADMRAIMQVAAAQLDGYYKAAP